MVNRLYADISKRLSKVTDDCGFEARVILETVLGRDYRLRALSGALGEPSETELAKIEKMILRRLSGEPLQYIIGEWEFFGLSFKVGRGVLIPRQDTETLVETSLKLLKDTANPQVLDLCSGTGCVAIAISNSRPDAQVSAIELYPEAYGILCENAKLFGGVTAMQADALDPETASKFVGLDLITANPPYLTAEDMENLQREVSQEPQTALFGGEDGLDFYRALSKEWYESLKDGGTIAYEIGLGQEEAVAEILKDCGYRDIEYVNDLTNRVRVVFAVK